MDGKRTVEQYRLIDLAFLALLLILSEAVIHMAATTVFADQLYIVSPVAVVTSLVMMRWGKWGLVHAALGGIALALLSGGSAAQFVIYGAGNLLCAGALIMLRGGGKQAVRGDTLRTMGFGALVQLLMQLGRALAALALGTPMELCAGFFTTDVLSLLFTVCVLALLRRVDGLFEDQRAYLTRTRNERCS